MWTVRPKALGNVVLVSDRGTPRHLRWLFRSAHGGHGKTSKPPNDPSPELHRGPTIHRPALAIAAHRKGEDSAEISCCLPTYCFGFQWAYPCDSLISFLMARRSDSATVEIVTSRISAISRERKPSALKFRHCLYCWEWLEIAAC